MNGFDSSAPSVEFPARSHNGGRSRAPPSDPVTSYESHDMHVAVERRSGEPVLVQVCGEVDTRSAPTLRSSLRDVLPAPHGIVVDLEGVGFLSTAGLSILLEAVHGAREHREELAVAASGRAVLRPLRATGLDGQIPTYSSVHAALDGLTQRT